MYPNSSDISFDIDYYKHKHLPMITATLGDALRYGVFKVGIGGRVPGRNCSLFCNWIPKFESVCSFFKLVWTHAETFAADVPNYPNSR
jgi:hypothetical protein